MLYESAVVCEFLDSLSAEASLHPATGIGRWRALSLQALADGAATAAGRLYADEHRADGERSAAMMSRFKVAIEATLDKLEAMEGLGCHLTIGEISLAAFVGYLDFRWPDRDWRSARPCLSGWYAHFSERPSMTSTEHNQRGGPEEHDPPGFRADTQEAT